jgi:hypothetical protein
MNIFDRLGIDKFLAKDLLRKNDSNWLSKWEQIDFKDDSKNCPILFASIVDLANRGDWSTLSWGLFTIEDRIKDALFGKREEFGNHWLVFLTRFGFVVAEVLDELVQQFSDKFLNSLDHRISANFLGWVARYVGERPEEFVNVRNDALVIHRPFDRQISTLISAYDSFDVTEKDVKKAFEMRGIDRATVEDWDVISTTFNVQLNQDALPIVFAAISDSAIRGQSKAFEAALSEIISYLTFTLFGEGVSNQHFHDFVSAHWWAISEVCIEFPEIEIPLVTEQNILLFFWFADEIENLNQLFAQRLKGDFVGQ